MIKGKVSVITPLYKSEKYIRETIRSVQNQTYENWEMLCIDDCSPDNTADIVKEIQKQDQRVKYLKRDKNYGTPAFGRNFGLEKAEGEYITFLDHDDTFEPNKFAEMIQYMEDQKVDFLVSNIYLYSDLDQKNEGMAWGNVLNFTQKDFVPRLLWRNFVPPNSTMTRRSIFDKVGNFDTTIKGVDDYDMWYRLSRASVPAIINQPLASWRYKNSKSMSADDLMMIENEVKFHQKIVEADWSEAWEKAMSKRCLLRSWKYIANRKLLVGAYSSTIQYYQKAGLLKMARLVQYLGPLVRGLYLIKYKLTNKIKPFTLNFAEYERD